MDQHRKHRKVLRAAFTKSANELDKLFSEMAALQQIQVAWEVLLQKHENLSVANRVVYDGLLQADMSEDELLLEMDSCEGYDKRFIDLKITYENSRQKHDDSVLDEYDRHSSTSRAVSNSISQTGMRKFKLPTIEFKTFGGEIRQWLSFWGQFEKINDDPNIDQADKFQYLIQATIPNSRARQLVESFPPIAENYEKVIDSLKSRFGRKDLQIEVYVRELLKLVIDNAISNNKMLLSTLYDKVETQLRALETLGIKNDNCAAMLFPLIESCLPEELLRVWHRSPSFSSAASCTQSVENSKTDLESPTMNRLECLMSFVKSEVENEERICLAAEGFGLSSGKNQQKKSNKQVSNELSIPTAAGLMNYNVVRCIFCEGSHGAENCFKARKYSLEQKRKISSDKNACFRCLKAGHQSRKCHARLKCLLCGKPHVALMCPELPANKILNKNLSASDVGKTETSGNEQSLANHTNTHVFLQTLRVNMISEHGVRLIRAVIDSGSQRSYVLKSTAEKLRYKPKHTERIIHSLFGGSNTAELLHNCYDIRLNVGNYSCSFEVLDQSVICNNISPVFHGCWLEELQHKHIQLNDVYDSDPIELLIGADVAGKLYTGRRYILKCGLVAVETLLGWTLMGKIPDNNHGSTFAMTALSLFIKNASIADLWELDVLGIREPAEKKSREEVENATKKLFLQTVTTDIDGRYEVRMPWLEGHPPIPDNYALARKRLTSTMKKLQNEDLYGSYNDIFDEWLREGIIEEVTSSSLSGQVHYLPHRPVIKESSVTTKIRPVFDASAREKDNPALNFCLEKGPNLIELIPSILQKFRKENIGVISDIRKAFLQIGLHEADRDFLRFLWIDSDGKEKIYRHRRVVFGVSCSPFLLGATIEYHLSRCLEKSVEPGSNYSQKTIEKLSESFYVDNCITSVPDEETLQKFIRESSILMAEAKFDLRGWEHTKCDSNKQTMMPVLGLTWNISKDTLMFNQENICNMNEQIITKRMIQWHNEYMIQSVSLVRLLYALNYCYSEPGKNN